MQKQSKQTATHSPKKHPFSTSRLYRPDALRSFATVAPRYDTTLDGLTTAQIAAICHVSEKTVSRWRRGVQLIHPAHRALLDLHRTGRILPADWLKKHGVRTAPAGGLLWCGSQHYALTGQELGMYFAKLQLLRTLETESDRYRRELDAARERIAQLEAMLPKAPVVALTGTSAKGSTA